LNGRIPYVGDYVRLGYSWFGKTFDTGVPVFRFAIGQNERLKFILRIRDFPYSVTRPIILPRTF
jgi:hypothetical protein